MERVTLAADPSCAPRLAAIARAMGKRAFKTPEGGRRIVGDPTVISAARGAFCGNEKAALGEKLLLCLTVADRQVSQLSEEAAAMGLKIAVPTQKFGLSSIRNETSDVFVCGPRAEAEKFHEAHPSLPY